MGLTDSTDLIEEHWIDEISDIETTTKAQKQEELVSSSAKAVLKKEEAEDVSLDEDELNEEKMWIDAISLSPKSSSLRNQLANHYFHRNRFEEAEFAYHAAMNLDNCNSIAHYDYAFMRHHQFYWCLAKCEMDSAYKYALECEEHYMCVLSLEKEDDIETHYQLSLLYLTQLETTLIESIDSIESVLNGGGGRGGKGKDSRWYGKRKEMHALCLSHLKMTHELCGDNNELIRFGSLITSARLLYVECIPNCFIFYSLSTQQKVDKLRCALSYLRSALEMNGCDATLHHDFALILSHEVIGEYWSAIDHWLIAHELDATNVIYTSQLGAMYQYHVVSQKGRENARKYYELSLAQNGISRDLSASIFNNLGILAATQNDIVSATTCWKQCLSRNPNHCEAHRNLGNILWLHLHDENKSEIHLQRAIAIASPIYDKISENDSSSLLRDKFCTFLSQCKSDYGGLLLMMFKYDRLAEKQLRDALQLDANCVSAHYYLAKYFFDFCGEYASSALHFSKYLELEVAPKNAANRAHSHQILGEIFLTKWYRFCDAQCHFKLAIEIGATATTTLPVWAQCKMYCGFADSIVAHYVDAIYAADGITFKSCKTQDFVHQVRSRLSNSSDEVRQLQSKMETAKKHYRAILKMDSAFVAAPLGLAHIFDKIEGKTKLAEAHYNQSIGICKAKLIKLCGRKSDGGVDDEKKKKKKVKFCHQFDISKIDQKSKEYLLLCIESHLGKVDLIMVSCHNGKNRKWKEALAHCNQCIYLDASNCRAHTNKALLYAKLNQEKKARQAAECAQKLIITRQEQINDEMQQNDDEDNNKMYYQREKEKLIMLKKKLNAILNTT